MIPAGPPLKALFFYVLPPSCYVRMADVKRFYLDKKGLLL